MGEGLSPGPANLVGVPSQPLEIDGLPLDNLSADEALDRIAQAWRRRESLQVCFVNAHCVNVAHRDEEYRRIVRDCWLRLPDGAGVRWGARMLGQRVRENLNGTDFFPRLCARLDQAGGSVALLGARPGRAEGVARWLAHHYPRIQVRSLHHGYLDAEQQEAAVKAIADARCDVVLVALGVPAQEKWLAAHAARLHSGVCLSVGALFDFYSGSIPRAPLWMRAAGFEWVYRLLLEPRRMWRRYLVGNVAFLFRVLQERLR